ncbi:MAG: response regulator [Chloroflexi bacterium]|nr:response regulator [Chloroflexota bacterium]
MADRGKILVIDDDSLFCQMTAAILGSRGYQVEVATSRDEGLSKMEASRPDLVVLDVMMDWVLDGVSLSREMMDSAALRDIPIVMCTSIRNSEYRGYFPQDEYLHIDDWLDKPCSPADLVSAVERILARRGRFRALARP